jgi:hypothetical protein
MASVDRHAQRPQTPTPGRGQARYPLAGLEAARGARRWRPRLSSNRWRNRMSGRAFASPSLGVSARRSVDKMELRRSTTELTNDRACRIRRNDDEFGYLHNATEALAELMMSLQRRSSPEAGPAVT